MARREFLALVLLFAISLPAVTPRLYASDEVEYFAWLRSIAFDQDVDFENEYQYFYDAGVSRSPEFHETFLERTNEAGRRINYAPIGTPILWAPFYAAAHVVARASGATVDGYSRPYIAAIAYGSACYAFFAVLLSAAIARRIVGRGLGASLLIATGTPLVFYAYVAPGFSHAASAFAAALFLWTWLVVRDRWTASGAIALGVCGGLMAMVREQDVLLVIGPGLDFLRHSWRQTGLADARRSPRPLVAAIAGTTAFLAACAPQLLAYYALNGHPGPTETAARKMTWTAPHAISVLVNPDHGLFAWTPLAIIAIAGLLALAMGALTRATPVESAARHPDARWFGVLALLMIAGQAYMSGSVESWSVAGSFGQRRFLALTPLLTVGLAAALAWARPPVIRPTLLALVAVCVWWNLGLMAQFGLNRMDRQTLTLAKNARMTFLELPFEAPGLVWRYLTDRSSFYRQPPQ